MSWNELRGDWMNCVADTKVPSNEMVWVQYWDEDKLQYVITSKIKDRDMYYLYVPDGDKLKRIARNKDPRILEKRMR